jgi:hypothetical protein
VLDRAARIVGLGPEKQAPSLRSRRPLAGARQQAPQRLQNLGIGRRRAQQAVVEPSSLGCFARAGVNLRPFEKNAPHALGAALREPVAGHEEHRRLEVEKGVERLAGVLVLHP